MTRELVNNLADMLDPSGTLREAVNTPRVGDRARVVVWGRRGDDYVENEYEGEVVYFNPVWVVIVDRYGVPHRFAHVRDREHGTEAWPKVEVRRV